MNFSPEDQNKLCSWNAKHFYDAINGDLFVGIGNDVDENSVQIYSFGQHRL